MRFGARDSERYTSGPLQHRGRDKGCRPFRRTPFSASGALSPLGVIRVVLFRFLQAKNGGIAPELGDAA